ncbi:MAG: hypothetical protein Q4E83_05110 [bacterium]|nr:hypothetical protein [bacterium]
MEIFTNFKQIEWHWNKTKQKKLETSLKHLDKYLISIDAQENKTELLLHTATNNIIELLNDNNLTFGVCKQRLQVVYDTMILDTNISTLVSEKVKSQFCENIQAIDSNYDRVALQIEIYRFLIFIVGIFERIANISVFENHINFSVRKSKITKQQKIIQYYINNKSITQKQISEILGTSLAYVKKVINSYNNLKRSPK